MRGIGQGGGGQRTKSYVKSKEAAKHRFPQAGLIWERVCWKSMTSASGRAISWLFEKVVHRKKAVREGPMEVGQLLRKRCSRAGKTHGTIKWNHQNWQPQLDWKKKDSSKRKERGKSWSRA